MLAIKELRSDSFKDFEQEEIALRRIHSLDDDHLIKVIASIKRGEKYHFLFPWADGGNLRRVWEDMNKKPRTAELIRWVFEQMKGTAGAIAKLHNPSNTSEENGRHGDLKPENILFFPDKNGRGTLVITDVGLTRFHIQVTNKRVNKTDTTDASIEYGPPEALNDDVRSRKYDIWSLGCIFFEFTIWVFGGIDELQEFKKARSGKSKDCQYYYNKTSPKVHPKVGVYINKLRNDSRCRGCAGFHELLNLIENDLLKVNVADRLDAFDLEKRLEDILRKAEQHVSYLFSNPNGNGSFYPQPLPRGRLT
jgi:serine/threonine protein kinase